MVVEQRQPLTRETVIAFLNKGVEETEKKWGVNYFYSVQARSKRDALIEKYDMGQVVPVYSVQYTESYGNGCGDFVDTLYSDGNVKTTCYGYTD